MNRFILHKVLGDVYIAKNKLNTQIINVHYIATVESFILDLKSTMLNRHFVSFVNNISETLIELKKYEFIDAIYAHLRELDEILVTLPENYANQVQIVLSKIAMELSTIVNVLQAKEILESENV